MNILILGGTGKNPGANSVCVRNMGLEFISQGHKVWNLAEGDSYVNESTNWDGLTLWEVPSVYHIRLARKVERTSNALLKVWFKIESLFRHLAILAIYPNTSISRSQKVYKKAREIVEEKSISLVVAIFNCYENIYAGMRLKQLMGDGIKVVSYHLDLRTASLNSSSLIRFYVKRNAIKSIVKESRIVDKILIPYSGQEEMERMEGLVRNKVHYVGFPVFITSKGLSNICPLPFKENCINISYIGTLSSDNRDPRPVLETIEQVSKRIRRQIMVHFWGNAGDLTMVLEASPIVSYHGKTENKYVRYIMDHSDFLLNIGNAIAYDMLPSKTFGMFATGKPIINVVNHPKDATLPFFARYGHSIDLFYYEKRIDKTEILFEGIMKLDGKINENVDGLFDDFKPETICNMIMR